MQQISTIRRKKLPFRSRCSISHLPVEIIEQIILATYPATRYWRLAPLARVCHLFKAIVTPLLYRHIRGFYRELDDHHERYSYDETGLSRDQVIWVRRKERRLAATLRRPEGPAKHVQVWVEDEHSTSGYVPRDVYLSRRVPPADVIRNLVGLRKAVVPVYNPVAEGLMRGISRYTELRELDIFAHVAIFNEWNWDTTRLPLEVLRLKMLHPPPMTIKQPDDTLSMPIEEFVNMLLIAFPKLGSLELKICDSHGAESLKQSGLVYSGKKINPVQAHSLRHLGLFTSDKYLDGGYSWDSIDAKHERGIKIKEYVEELIGQSPNLRSLNWDMRTAARLHKLAPHKSGREQYVDALEAGEVVELNQFRDIIPSLPQMLSLVLRGVFTLRKGDWALQKRSSTCVRIASPGDSLQYLASNQSTLRDLSLSKDLNSMEQFVVTQTKVPLPDLEKFTLKLDLDRQRYLGSSKSYFREGLPIKTILPQFLSRLLDYILLLPISLHSLTVRIHAANYSLYNGFITFDLIVYNKFPDKIFPHFPRLNTLSLELLCSPSGKGEPATKYSIECRRLPRPDGTGKNIHITLLASDHHRQHRRIKGERIYPLYREPGIVRSFNARRIKDGVDNVACEGVDARQSWGYGATEFENMHFLCSRGGRMCEDKAGI